MTKLISYKRLLDILYDKAHAELQKTEGVHGNIFEADQEAAIHLAGKTPRASAERLFAAWMIFCSLCWRKKGVFPNDS